MTFPGWTELGSYSGALGMVLVLTQLTKEMPVIRRIPTRLWSYLTALAVMLCALVFNGTPSPSQILLTCFHAAVVALAANGGYDAAAQVLGGGKTEK